MRVIAGVIFLSLASSLPLRADVAERARYLMWPAPEEVERAVGGSGERGIAAGSYPESEPEQAPTRPEPIDHSKLVAQDADTLGKGVWQVQFNSSLSRSRGQWDLHGRDADSARAAEDLTGMVITLGVTRALDIGVEFGYSWLHDPEVDPSSDRGIGDPSVIAKWRFYGSDRRGLWVAYTPALTAPAGRDGGPGEPGSGGRAWTIDNRISLVSDLTRRLTANLDVGRAADFAGGDALRWSGVSANGALGYQVTPFLQPEIELSYVRETGGGERGARTLAGTLGLVSSPSDMVSFRLGVQHSLAGRNSDRNTTVLLSLDITG